MRLIPGQDKKYSQTNNGDVLGSLYYTKNINFQKEGYLSLARKTQYVHRIAGNGSPNNFGVGYNAVYDPSVTEYALATSNGCYLMNYTTLVVTRDNTTTNPSSGNDCIYWNGALYFMMDGTAGIKKRTAGTWASALGTTPANTDFHTFCINETTNELLFTDGNLIKKITTGDAFSTVLTLPSIFRARWIVYSNSRIYIGTLNTSAGNGKVFLWDGTSSAPLASYDVNAQTAVAGCKYQSTVAVMNSLGQLSSFNGSGFTEMAQLPVYNEPEFWKSNTFISGGYVPLFPKSIVSQGDYIYMTIGNSQVGTVNGYIPSFPSGVYTYDPKVGLYHRYSLTPYNDTTGYGTLFPFTTDSGICCLLAEPNLVGSLPALTVGTELFFSMSVPDSAYSSAGSYNTICSPVTGENRGYFVTNKIYSEGVTDINQKLFIRYRNVFGSNDKIKIKYRSSERSNVPVLTGSSSSVAGTWTSTTVFTSTDPLLISVAVGDEFEIWSGKGAGKTALVSSISLVSTTYTVTLDTAIGTNTESVGGAFWNWKLLQTIDNTFQDYAEVIIGQPSKFIQFKVEIEGEDVQIEEMRIINVINQPNK